MNQSKSTNHSFEIDMTVDASGLNCPLPILKARKALMSLQAGQILKVIATDPVSVEDFPTFAKSTGNHLLASEQNGEQFTFFLRVG